jgi:hypothetical protein
MIPATVGTMTAAACSPHPEIEGFCSTPVWFITAYLDSGNPAGDAVLNQFLPTCCLAAATTWSGSKPNFFWSSFSGAEAPKVFMPMTSPELPT